MGPASGVGRLLGAVPCTQMIQSEGVDSLTVEGLACQRYEGHGDVHGQAEFSASQSQTPTMLWSVMVSISSLITKPDFLKVFFI